MISERASAKEIEGTSSDKTSRARSMRGLQGKVEYL